jgi:integrase
MLTEKGILKALRESTKAGRDQYEGDSTGAHGGGSLLFRARPNGAGTFYFRYYRTDGKRDAIVIGPYDPSGAAGGVTLKTARNKFADLSRRYQSGERDLRAHLEHDHAERRAKIEQAKHAREEAERMASAGTLQALLEGYADYLEHRGKQAAYDVRNIVELHVSNAFPALAKRRANAITRADCNTILSRLIEAGKGRTAAKLRSYARSAYNIALQADSDPTVPPALRGFAVEVNPWASVPAKSFTRFNRALDRTLSETELRAYMQALDALPDGATKRALWLALRLGGQRPKQLVRATVADVDMDAGTITLRDPKGARQHARVHVLPLPKRATELVAEALAVGEAARERRERRDAEGGQAIEAAYLFTYDGKRPLRAESMTKAVTDIATAMIASKKARAPFALRDLRRSCETLFASMGVSSDIRAQLQSHGLGGVQQRHYDKYGYEAEKSQVLEAWERKLQAIKDGAPAGNVVELRPRKKDKSRTEAGKQRGAR